MPPALGLGMPFSASPRYTIPIILTPEHPVALGPVWQGDAGLIRLAALEPVNAPCFTVHQETEVFIAWDLQWEDMVCEHYLLISGELNYQVSGPHDYRLIVPLLISDGHQETQITMHGQTVEVTLNGQSVRYQLNSSALIKFHEELIANRHGTYRLLEISSCEELTISFIHTQAK